MKNGKADACTKILTGREKNYKISVLIDKGLPMTSKGHKIKYVILSICIVLILGEMVCIFVNSAMNDVKSSAQSGFFADLLGKIFLPPDPDAQTMQRFESALRVAGHFLEFMALGVFTSALVSFLIRCDAKKSYWYGVSWAACILYALTDEWHQMFVPGRAAEWFDVMIDSLGALSGTALCALISLLIIRRMVLKKAGTAGSVPGETGQNQDP